MKTENHPTHQIESDGYSVWVHDARGFTVGRFGRTGVDVHHGLEAQSATGKQCLDCTHGFTGPAEWLRFKNSMRDHHEIEVKDDHRPRYIGPDVNADRVT